MCVLGGVMVHWTVSFHFLFFVLLVSIVFSDLCCKDVREPEVLVIFVFTGLCVYIVCSECAWASWSFSYCKVIRAKLDWATFLSFLFLFFSLNHFKNVTWLVSYWPAGITSSTLICVLAVMSKNNHVLCCYFSGNSVQQKLKRFPDQF